MEKPKPLTQQQGQQAEQIACDYLQAQGLTLVCRNFNCKVGEIDLIMQQQDMLIFVEVRYRRHQQFGSASASVTSAKQRKIIRAAQFFLMTRPQYAQFGARFDVIAIDKTLFAPIQWIPAAFLTY